MILTKKLIAVVLALILCFSAAHGETPSPEVESMLPILDAWMHASIQLCREYDFGGDATSDRVFFWTVLGIVCDGWMREDPQCEVLDDELRVPRAKMQELASAAFSDFSELPSLPPDDFFIRYDDAWDSYFVSIDPQPRAQSAIRASHSQPNGTITVEVALADSESHLMNAVLVQRSGNPSFPYSVAQAEITPSVQQRRSLSLTLDQRTRIADEVLYIGSSGYEIWLPDGLFKIVQTDEGDRFALADGHEDSPASLLIAATPDDLPPESWLDDRASVHTSVLESGLQCHWKESSQNGLLERQYVLEGNGHLWTATLSCPPDDAELFDTILQTMRQAG